VTSHNLEIFVFFQIDKYKKSLPLYIDNYPKIVAKMEKVCKLMVEACEPLKRWVSADAKYAQRLQEEISRFNKRKMDLSEIIKLLENDREKNQQRVKKATDKLTKVESQVRPEYRPGRRGENIGRKLATNESQVPGHDGKLQPHRVNILPYRVWDLACWW